MTTNVPYCLSRRAVIGALASLIPASVGAEVRRSSKVTESMASTLTLVDGGLIDGLAGKHRTGIHITLKPGFKTYWRSPGDTGVPPIFDFSASENVATTEVKFPKPLRFPDGAGGQSIGYDTAQVLFPVHVTAKDASKPVLLRLKADYPICKDICIPSSAEAEMLLGQQASVHSTAIKIAESKVPQLKRLGEAGELAIRALHRGSVAEGVLVEIKAGHSADLFVEAPSPWFFETRLAPTGSGPARFEIVALERDRTPDCKGADLTLTLVSGDQAIEVKTWLDVSLLGS